jgi:hypothetical protein
VSNKKAQRNGNIVDIRIETKQLIISLTKRKPWLCMTPCKDITLCSTSALSALDVAGLA